MDRRTFLQNSGLLAAALVGVGAFPGLAWAQDQSGAAKDKTDDPKASGNPDGKGEPAADKNGKSPDKNDKAAGNNETPDKNDKKEEQKDAKAGSSPDPFKETRKDDQGRDYRLCPQCGYNMYRQDKTWTCENCG